MLKVYSDKANLCTLVGLWAGLISLILIVNGELLGALLAILTGALADVFDGPLARSAKQRVPNAGPFGQELDTVADMCHSVLAPSLWIASVQNFSAAGIGCAVLLVTAGATRLSYFTAVKPPKPGYFIGVPVTYLPVTLGGLVILGGPHLESYIWVSFSLLIGLLQTKDFMFPKFTGWKFYLFALTVMAFWLGIAIEIIHRAYP
ncbi:hypothetical protein GOZ89_25230 [Agrobacterium vitis]|uniref:CDP-alcohol phosphatidyltransferase family protein n=1 Tax=Agrobacterium vitis TaxID=373 RepID=UPI0008733FE4|nr:CDP-alcohol phosphatidyltransferase family protein [Agrobacterium vitis]MCE6078516.1 hypothetical protein [Agrobacterium vitis]MCF1455940.1 hypothetical protein [Agrobacterium vitis]MCF1470224.1 hypothetical protein [Agrobacterium vitis]MCM2453694.1 hypothetical protein [Agrobacterium vitis]MUO73523.1 hypothetical protein [Agrobacterium vitis]